MTTHGPAGRAVGQVQALGRGLAAPDAAIDELVPFMEVAE